MSATDSNDLAQGLWMSVSELAVVRGIDKSAISRRLQRLQAGGARIGTRREGRSLLVNVADFDVAVGEHGDRARETGEATKKGGSLDDPIYSREQARRMSYEADIKKIELARLRGELILVADLSDAAMNAGETILRGIDQWVGRAEELANAANVPVSVARVFLKAATRDLRQRIADTMQALAATTTAVSAATESEDDHEG